MNATGITLGKGSSGLVRRQCPHRKYQSLNWDCDRGNKKLENILERSLKNTPRLSNWFRRRNRQFLCLCNCRNHGVIDVGSQTRPGDGRSRILSQLGCLWGYWKDLHRKCPQNKAEIEFSTWRTRARAEIQKSSIYRGTAMGVDRTVRNAGLKSRGWGQSPRDHHLGLAQPPPALPPFREGLEEL